MKRTLSARRVPRKIGHDDDDDDDDDGPRASSAEGERLKESSVNRATSKPRKSSALRTSFAHSATEGDGDDDGEAAAGRVGGSGVVTPKRSNLSRVAMQRNASRLSSHLAQSIGAGQSDEDGDDNDRPSYSAASLQELKASTPSTPRELSVGKEGLSDDVDVDALSTDAKTLDLTSKFGSSLSRYQQQTSTGSVNIPSAAEIAEKKARRSRLAAEQAAQEFISLDPDDPGLSPHSENDDDDNVTRDERGRLILKPKDKYQQSESRLVRDDEDVLEDFDEFTQPDTKILLGREAEAQAARRRRGEMAAQIAAAEGAQGGDDGDDVDGDESGLSERERNAAFEAAQTRHGLYAASATGVEDTDAQRPSVPAKIAPLPTLGGVIDRLRKQVSEMQSTRMQKLAEMEALKREKVRLAEEEVRIQQALRETGEKFAALRAEKGIAATGVPALGGEEGRAQTGPAAKGEGLENDGSFESAEAQHDPSERAGLGLGFVGRGLESLTASTAGTPVNGDLEDASSHESEGIAC